MTDCLCWASSFVLGLIPNEQGGPMTVALPCCSEHSEACARFVVRYSPYGEADQFEIGALPIVQEQMGDLWLYERGAA